MDKREQKINIAIAINDAFVMPAIVMLNSLLKQTREQVRIILLYNQLSQKNLLRLKQLVEIDGAEFTEILIDDDLFFNASLNNNPLYSVEIYYRILLPYLTDVDKILWLDADIIVNGDIAELYDIDISEAYIGAAIDIQEVTGGRKSIKKILGIENQVYFNSGVLLMNSKKIREEISEERFFEAIDQYNNDLKCPDQDILNLVLGGNMVLLEERYNNLYHMDNKRYLETAQALIIHYYWKKPWNKDYSGFLDKPFWCWAKKSGFWLEYVKYSVQTGPSKAIKRGFQQLLYIRRAFLNLLRGNKRK